MTRTEKIEKFNQGLLLATDKKQVVEYMRGVCFNSLFLFLLFVLKRRDINNDFCYDRCAEVEQNPDNYLDLWAREHYKSTVITFAQTIREIIANPEITIGIFSHTRPIAKGFLRQIKAEFENNHTLYSLFPETFYLDPRKESPKWSEDDGIICTKRKSNPKESTVEAWGLVDGQPTSKHYQLLIYDDIVTLESVSTPEQMKKTTDAWAMSLNLGTADGRRRYAGTRFHFLDTYSEIIRRGSAIPRVRPATKDGTMTGEPVLLTYEQLRNKRRDFGSYVFSCQMLLNPIEDSVQGFDKKWLRYWEPSEYKKMGMNIYILCDPASSKKKGSDYTVFMVIGLAADNNYYVIDMVRDRLSLTERADTLFKLVQMYRPIKVGYEKYGMQSDIEHIKDKQNRENYRFQIVEVKGQTSKEDRIRGLTPLFEFERMYLPHVLYRTNYEKRQVDVTKEFVEEEYLFFPVATHDDMLDCMARILDEEFKAMFPSGVSAPRQKRHRVGAMAA